MNFVEPIRDIQKIKTMKSVLRNNPRNELLFVLGINSALRVSDLLRLRVSDVLDESHNLKNAVILKEQKTGKTKSFPINDSVRNALKRYFKTQPPRSIDAPLFPSRSGGGALTRKQAWAILQQAGKSIGLDNIGTHSLRKTFGYHVYRKTNDLAIVQQLLGHSNSSDTLRYIGITQEQLFDAYLDLNL